MKDAELNAAEDKKKLELVQAKNQGDSLVHSRAQVPDRIRRQAGEAGEKDKIEAAIGRLKKPSRVRTGRHRSQDQRPDDRQQKLGEEDLRRHASWSSRWR